jgi:hypothetical protein
VILEGFLLDVNSPDVESLSITVDCTALSGEDYLGLIRELEDVLSDMDRAYAERQVRGRTLKGRYRRHLAENGTVRTRKLTLIPYPSNLANLPGNLRRSLYHEINRRCLTLQRDIYGRMHRVVYLLPFSQAPELMLYVDELNKAIDRLNQELARLRVSEVPKVVAILRKYGVWRDGYSIPSELHEFSISPRPVRLDPSVINHLPSLRAEIEEERRRGLDLLRQELENQRRTLVTEAITSLRRQIEAIASGIVEARKRPEYARAELERIRELAESSGLRALNAAVVDPLIEAIEHPERREELMGSSDLMRGISMRTKGLIDSL